jgi:ABC-type transport system involved in multi-copper enzyme maturation permease subunit
MTGILTIAAILWYSALRRKDVYVLLILLASLLVLLVSMNVFGLGSAVGYIKDIGLLMAWLAGWILAVLISAREIPHEEASGTIFTILSKPVTRAELVIGKWLGAWTVATTALFCFYVLTLGVARMKGGTINLAVCAQAFAAHSVVLGILCTMALALSTRLHSDAAATLTFVASAASFFVVPGIPEYMTRETGWQAGFLMFLYNLLPHFEVLDFRRLVVHDYDAVSAAVFLPVMAYGIALIILFLFLAWLLYRNKLFARGTMGE